MEGNILVELGNDGDFVGIRTYDREHGEHGRFLFAWSTLLLVLMGNERQIRYDKDCGDFAELWREGECLWIRFTWLSQYDRNHVQGFIQTIRLPKATILSMLGGKCRRKHLCKPVRRQAKIDATEAAGTIRLILRDKLTRRAFIKAMRDCFKWQDDEVKLYRDGGYNFYFTTASGFPKCGGLILNEGGGNVTYPYVHYSVHT